MKLDLSKARSSLDQARLTFKQLQREHPEIRPDYKPPELYNRIQALVTGVGQLQEKDLQDSSKLASDARAFEDAAQKLRANLESNRLTASSPQSQVAEVTSLISNAERDFAAITGSPRPLDREISDILRELSGVGNADADSRSALISAFVERLISRFSSLETTLSKSAEVVAKVVAFEREASTAKQNAEASAVTATAASSAVESTAQELVKAIAQRDALFAEFEKRRESIDALLKNANKVGLARSFQQRGGGLQFAQIIWAVIFFVGIALLIAGGYLELNAVINALNSPSALMAFFAVLVRLLVAGPAIWLTWFAAKQYGHTLRLREDYAFKEASAMAYIGYRDEMAADPEMLALLRRSAVTTFGENPLRILSQGTDHATPLSEALQKLDVNKVLDQIGAVLDKFCGVLDKIRGK